MYYDIHKDVEAFSTERHEELPYFVLQPHQTHTANVAVITDPQTTREDLYDIDALVTNIPDFAIGVRTADCVPVLLYDPVSHAIAAIHSGWKGTVQRIVERTVSTMQSEYGTSPSDLLAVIGPCISVDSFQVGAEVVEQFRQAGFPIEIIHRYDGAPATEPLDMRGGHHIDLWESNRWLLCQSGVKAENIQIAGIDTFTDQRYFSARREGNQKTKRIINVIKYVENK